MVAISQRTVFGGGVNSSLIFDRVQREIRKSEHKKNSSWLPADYEGE